MIKSIKILFKRLLESLENKKIIKDRAYHILCVDSDKDFVQYFKKLAKSHRITVEMAYSIEEAKAKIKAGSYRFNAFVIDADLSDGSGIECVAWMRERGVWSTVVFLSRAYQNAANFHLLKETFKVDHVLEKPLAQGKADRLFAYLRVKRHHSASSEDRLLEACLTDLKANYRQSIYDKVEHLEKAIVNVQKHSTKKQLTHLKNEIHALVESPNAYGSAEASKLCETLEDEIDEHLQRPAIDPEWLASLNEFFSSIKFYFQINPDLSVSYYKPIYKPHQELHRTIYIINEDKEWLDQIDRYKQTHPHNFLVLTESNPQRALDLLASPDFTPRLTLINDSYSSFKPADFLTVLMRKKDASSSQIGLIVDQMERSLNAFQEGIDYLIRKPLNVNELFFLMAQSLQELNKINILLIHDDLDVERQVSLALKEIGANCKVIQESAELKKQVVAYRPDCLMIDESLLRRQFEIIQELKTCPALQQLVIIGLAASSDSAFSDARYQQVVDEFLIKPLNDSYLQSKILELRKKREVFVSFDNKETLLGLLTRASFDLYLSRRFIGNHETFSFPLVSIVLFEMEDFQEIKRSMSKEMEAQSLYLIGEALTSRLKRKEAVAYKREGVFAVLFNGLDAHAVRFLMQAFFDDLKPRLDRLTHAEIKFNCGISLLPLSYTSVEQLTRKAERALLYARQQKKEAISLACLPEDEIFFKKKEVLIVGPKCEQLFKSMFEQTRFSILTFDLIQSVFDRLEQLRHEKIMPLLLIDHQAIQYQNQFLKKIEEAYPLQWFVMISSIEFHVEILQELRENYLNQENCPLNLLLILRSI